MLLTLIKNNTKILLRSKTSFVFMCLLPIVLTLILTSAFSSMGKKFEVDSFTVGYSLSERSEYETFFNILKEQFKENGINLKEMSKEEAIKALGKGEIASFVIAGDKKYTLYNEEGIHVEPMIFESTFQGSMTFYDGIKTLMSSIKNNDKAQINKIAEQVKSSSIEQSKSFVKREILKTDPVPSSQDYYGITEIVFIILFSITSAIYLSEGERKNKISNRIKLTNVKPLTLFLGRMIPNILATCVQVGIAMIVSILLLKVSWGEHFFLSGAILLGEVIAISAFGTMLTVVMKSSTFPTIFTYVGAFIFGLAGGSFETYMSNAMNERIVRLSPVYYLNRTLVELSTKGTSNLINITLVMLLIITICSFIIGLCFMGIRRDA